MLVSYWFPSRTWAECQEFRPLQRQLLLPACCVQIGRYIRFVHPRVPTRYQTGLMPSNKRNIFASKIMAIVSIKVGVNWSKLLQSSSVQFFLKLQVASFLVSNSDARNYVSM
jgi:hypothetical protein